MLLYLLRTPCIPHLLGGLGIAIEADVATLELSTEYIIKKSIHGLQSMNP